MSSLEIGLAAMALRETANPGAVEALSAEDQACLRATSDRFHKPKLRALDKGERAGTFECSDQTAFLSAIGATDAQKTYLEEFLLRLEITEFPGEDERVCVLYPEWPSDDSQFPIRRLPVIQFSATAPTTLADQGPLAILGAPPIGARYVDANSPEHADIAAIADFFQKVAK